MMNNRSSSPSSRLARVMVLGASLGLAGCGAESPSAPAKTEPETKPAPPPVTKAVKTTGKPKILPDEPGFHERRAERLKAKGAQK